MLTSGTSCWPRWAERDGGQVLPDLQVDNIYHIKELLQEVWDESDHQWVQAWGALRQDYSKLCRGNGTFIPQCRPYLIGITREEALRDPRSLAASLFLYNRPRLQFSQRAQDLVARAMGGDTDAELADALNISLPAVEMRWRAIYNRVESIASELFPA